MNRYKFNLKLGGERCVKTFFNLIEVKTLDFAHSLHVAPLRNLRNLKCSHNTKIWARSKVLLGLFDSSIGNILQFRDFRSTPSRTLCKCLVPQAPLPC